MVKLTQSSGTLCWAPIRKLMSASVQNMGWLTSAGCWRNWMRWKGKENKSKQSYSLALSILLGIYIFMQNYVVMIFLLTVHQKHFQPQTHWFESWWNCFFWTGLNLLNSSSRIFIYKVNWMVIITHVSSYLHKISVQGKQCWTSLRAFISPSGWWDDSIFSWSRYKNETQLK